MKDMIIMLQLHSVEISRETLVKIEGGRQHIKLSQLRGLKELLDVSYEIILEEEKNVNWLINKISRDGYDEFAESGILL